METSDAALLPEQMQIIGIQTLCRICANQNERLIGIFSEEAISNDLPNKINLYLPVRVHSTDELPLQCCWNCASTILAWHELVITCTEVDEKFRSSQFIDEKRAEETTFDTAILREEQDNLGCDSEGIESKAPTSLDDFATKSAKKRKQHEPLVLPLQDHPLDYINEIEHQLINPELVDNPDYKIDIDPSLSDEEDEDDEKKSDDESKSEEEHQYFGCEFCPAIFFSRESIDQHVATSHDDQRNKNVKTAVEANIKKEKRKHNKLDQDVINAAKVIVDGRIYYNCKDCGKNLHSPYTYNWHIRIHTGERPYVCDLCGKQFRVSQGLVRHLRETHEGIKKFPCDICGRMFATRRNVEEHRRIHTNERPYVCDLCGKSFKQKASLFVHKRSHKNYFPFKCTYCGQGFRTKPPLMLHVTRHTGEKPFKCDVCGRCFRIKYELKRHKLIHSDEKPWVCNVCGFSFRQKRYLRNHVKSNHAQ